MRKRFLIFSLFIVSGLFAVAQDNIPVKTVPTEIFKSVKKVSDTVKNWTWKRGGLLNANLSQGSLSNWAAGGDKFSMSINSYFNYYLYNKGKNHTWDNNVDMNFGFLKTTSLGARKNDDRLEFISKYGLRGDTMNKVYVSVLFDFRSQLFDGLTYYTADSGVLTSSFLSPAYVTMSAGIDYKPTPDFSLFLSPLTDRITIVSSKRLNVKGVYGVPAYHSYLSQVGAFASISFSKEIMKNVNYKGKMDLFTDYGHNPQNVDVYYTNLLAFKINKFLSATYSLDMIYDDDVRLFGKYGNSPGLQLKSLIGIGFLMPVAPAYN